MNREGTACEFFALEPLNGRLGGSTVRHLHKPKTSGAASVLVGNHIDLVHNSIRLEELAEVMIRRTKRKVAYKDIHANPLHGEKQRNDRQVIRNSMQEHKARARCRRNGEENRGGHTLSLVTPSY